MKRIFTLLALLSLSAGFVKAQIPDGSIAPDFNATDINGNTYNLYTLLNQGKTVYLDVFATWCGPCWAYHNSGALEELWYQYGPTGSGEVFVFAIEGDPSTNVNCLYGPSGCTGGTQGNWVDGTPYPIVNSASIANQYQINYYPTIFCICPANKKVYECGQLPTQQLWEFREAYCPNPVINTSVANISPVKCFGSSTGSLDIAVSGGTPPYTYVWSNGATTQDLANVPAGAYTCTITATGGLSTVTEQIVVPGPGEPLAISVVEITPVGCNGVLGSITVQASGGWDANYTYAWQNGQQGETAYALQPGNHLVSVTDDNFCTKTLVTTLGPPVYPTAAIAPPATVTCAQPNIQLNALASSQGDDFAYQWFASGGGNIVSGSTTLTPTVNAAGNYTLQVTNLATTCVAYAAIPVAANIAQPSADAGPALTVSCAQPSAILQGSGSSGPGISYLWTASNGGNIVSGAGTLTPTVNAAGTYTLQVTDAANGCTKTSAVAVSGNNTPPAAAASGGALTCLVNATTLNGTTNAQTPVFAWTGPNGYTSTAQNPVVGVAGTYNLVVTDAANGCSGTATANVSTNTTPPGATASGGVLTCAVTAVTLSGNSGAQNPVFAWTGPGGFSSALQNPAVNAAGDYQLTTTDPANGCTSTAATVVALNNTAPIASAATPGNLNCNATQIQINGSGSSQGANFNYAWTTANGNIVSGENTLTPLVNAAGDYNLLVTNLENACTATTAAAVNQSTAVVANIAAQTNVGCFSAADGSATVAPAGGVGAFNYVWSNGATTAAVTNLAAGSYVVTVMDGENCTASAAVLITQPDLLLANATATAQSANGVNDGTATTNPSGGTAAFAYLWSNGAATQTITGLAPGNYTVSVTDANNCTAVQTVTVNSFNCALSAAIAGTNISCQGASDGSAAVTLTGAANPVSYLWSNGATTAGITGLSPGNYAVSVTDANNCPASLNITVNEPVQLLANATASSETASGANDGEATAIPTGGTGSYAYAWSNGATTPVITGLAPGSYTVVVTDANNCTAVQTVVVNAFDCAVSIQITASNAACAGLSNGTATAVPLGGTAPYLYSWSNGMSTATIINLAAGIYTVSVTDDNACFAVQSITITEPQALSLAITETVNVVCPDDASGSITAEAGGGMAGYSYVWNNGANGPSATGLPAGSYSVMVTDANGCTQAAAAVITAVDNVFPTLVVQNFTASLDGDGIAEVSQQSLILSMSDNCAITEVIVDPAEFDCDQLGEHEVSVTIFDAAGNGASATAIVTIVDNLAPSVTCPVSTTHCASDNVVNYPAPVAVDNCLVDDSGEWELLAGLPSGSAFPPGVTTQTYAYTDASGNSGACSFDVIITQAVNIAADVLDDVNGQGLGAINLTVTGGTAPFNFKWTKDGQGFANTEDLNNLFAGLYTVEITDANGCVYQSASVEVGNTVVGVDEPLWLQGVQLRPNPTTGISSVVFAVLPDKAVDIVLIDAVGRTMFTVESEQQTAVQLDCSALPEGLYFVQFRSGQTVGMRKLIVSR